MEMRKAQPCSITYRLPQTTRYKVTLVDLPRTYTYILMEHRTVLCRDLRGKDYQTVILTGSSLCKFELNFALMAGNIYNYIY